MYNGNVDKAKIHTDYYSQWRKCKFVKTRDRYRYNKKNQGWVDDAEIKEEDNQLSV